MTLVNQGFTHSRASPGFSVSQEGKAGLCRHEGFPESVRGRPLRVVSTTLADLIEAAVGDWRWRFQDRRNNPWRDA